MGNKKGTVYRILVACALLLIIIALFAISQEAVEVIKLDKTIYSLSEKVAIKLYYADLKNSKLEVNAPDKTYTFLNPAAEITFLPKIQGSHEIRLLHNNEVVSSLRFDVYNNDMPENSQESVSTDKKEYLLGETVTLNLTTTGDLRGYTLELSSGSKIYKFFALKSAEVKFLPAMPGLYSLTLIKGIMPVSNSAFLVKDISSLTQENASIIEEDINPFWVNQEQAQVDINQAQAVTQIYDTPLIFLHVQKSVFSLHT